MTDTSENMFNESVSALVDGENSELDLRRILKRSTDSDDVKHVWHRYHLAGELMRKDRHASANAQQIDLSFLKGIQDEIADDTIVAPRASVSSMTQTWREGMGKLAVAASVAVAVLVGFQYIEPSSNSGGTSVAAQAKPSLPGPVVPAGFELPSITARTVSSVEGGVTHGSAVSVPLRSSSVAPTWAPNSTEELELQLRLRRIMLKHAESSAASGGLGVLPFARLEDPSTE